MILWGASINVFCSTSPVDMRKSFDSLAGLTRDFMGHNPLSGNLFVFFNKKRDKVKVLYWSKTGYCLFYKRLERGRFHIPVPGQDDKTTVELDQVELDMILDGIETDKVERGKVVFA